jgi:hypothetical protein
MNTSVLYDRARCIQAESPEQTLALLGQDSRERGPQHTYLHAASSWAETKAVITGPFHGSGNKTHGSLAARAGKLTGFLKIFPQRRMSKRMSLISRARLYFCCPMSWYCKVSTRSTERVPLLKGWESTRAQLRNRPVSLSDPLQLLVFETFVQNF